MIFKWFKRKNQTDDGLSELDYGQKPIIYDAEDEEYRKLIQDIMTKLDEIRELIHEMKEAENEGKSTKNR
jgi:hypothetical protein